MKRTVYNTMIGLMLACGLAMTSTGAMAQGRRPATNSNAAATGNRSVATATQKNNAATVTNNASSSRTAVSTSASKPSVSASTNPQVNRPSTGAGNRANSGNSNSSSSTVRPSTSGTSNSSSNNVRPSTSGTSNSVRPSTGGSSTISTKVTPSVGNSSAAGNRVNTTNIAPNGGIDKGGNKGNGGNTVRPGTGGNNGGRNGGGNVRPGNSGNHGGSDGNKGHVTPPTRRPNDNRPKVAGSVMTGGGPKVDYSTYRYNHNNNLRPRTGNDLFYNLYRNNSWSWINPIRPSVRPWRPTTVWVYRPIVTINVNRYSSYPTIGGVLGLSWGTTFNNALNYLYYSGYYIDGFMDNIVYLTDVSLLNYDWDDVMIQFDGNDRMDYVEFAYWNSSYDTSRFYDLYNYLCSMYGSPISYTNAMYSWYGGDGVGFVNLGLQYTPDYNYTVLAFGI